VGDRFHIGKVLLEVTAPRIPCGTLARRMNDREFVTRFREAERPGVYCRVIEPGYVRAGDEVVLKPYPGETVTILEVFRVFYESDPDLKTLQRHLAAPIAIRDRLHKQRQLEKLSSKTGG
jgi:MOSC domain-containing protein YiiM